MLVLLYTTLSSNLGRKAQSKYNMGGLRRCGIERGGVIHFRILGLSRGSWAIYIERLSGKRRTDKLVCDWTVGGGLGLGEG